MSGLTTFVRLLLLIIAVPCGIARADAIGTGDTTKAVLLGIACGLSLLAQAGFARLSKPY
jgi:hypothetical protein